MTLADLIDIFRERAEDTAQPYLWSDDTLLRFASEAQRQACIRAHLLRDSTTTAICELDVAADATDVGLSPLVLDVLKARLDGIAQPLGITSADQMDADDDQWEARSPAQPTHLVLERNGAGLAGRLWPTPIADVTLRLRVIRLPLLAAFTDGDETPEIPTQLHEQLVDWMLHLAYLKKDAETFDPDAAATAAARFTASFGELPDANVRRKQADRRPNVVAFNPF